MKADVNLELNQLSIFEIKLIKPKNKYFNLPQE